MAKSEYLTVAEAQHELGVNKRKMADLIRKGDLKAEENPFDRRSKLVQRADVEALKAKMPARASASRPASTTHSHEVPA